VVFNPSSANPSTGWFTATGGYTPQTSYAGETGQPGDPTSSAYPAYSETNPPFTNPSAWTSQQWNAYISKITLEAQTASSGFERWKARMQLEDAQKGRDNEAALQQMRNDASKYGTDIQRQTAIDQLAENARQYDLNHGLEMQKLGLSRAQTATDYLSTPDRYIEGASFLDLSGRVLSGGGYAQPAGDPQMKTMADYQALENGGNPGRQVSSAQVGGNAADPRVKALKAVIDAAPPSADPGLDNNGYAVLQAAKHIYSMNLTPQQQAQIKGDKQYQQMLASAGGRAGYNPDQWWQKQQQSLPGQSSRPTLA
jgi:hypothetical protein